MDRAERRLEEVTRHSGERTEHTHDHDAMLREMRAPWLWTNATVMSLGLWLLSSPFTFGYTSRAMIWSDLASGVLLVLFGGMALVPRFDFIGRWSVATLSARSSSRSQ